MSKNQGAINRAPTRLRARVNARRRVGARFIAPTGTSRSDVPVRGSCFLSSTLLIAGLFLDKCQSFAYKLCKVGWVVVIWAGVDFQFTGEIVRTHDLDNFARDLQAHTIFFAYEDRATQIRQFLAFEECG